MPKSKYSEKGKNIIGREIKISKAFTNISFFILYLFNLTKKIDKKFNMTISKEFKLSEATGDRIVSGIKTLMAIKLARP